MKRLIYIMESRSLKQVDIINECKPFSELYDVKFNKSDLSQYISGKTEPNQDKLFILSEALNVNVAWLMGYDVPMEKCSVEFSQSQSNTDIDTLITQKYGDDCMNAILLYTKLDANDRAELRGEMKQMLKADKYNTKNESKHA